MRVSNHGGTSSFDDAALRHSGRPRIKSAAGLQRAVSVHNRFHKAHPPHALLAW
jgi:hypothetical protein